jgi:hypothetical protein
MKVQCGCGREVAVSDTAVLSEAGRISARRRKHGPMKLHACPRCGEKILGLGLLKAHIAICPAPAVREVTPEDMAALAWTPDDVR